MDISQKLILYSAAIIVFFVALYFFKLYYEVEGVRAYYREKKTDWWNIALVLAAALLVKMAFAAHYEGHGTDMNCFYAWSDMIFDNGIGKFYYLDAFTDYPPGYMAILWVIAAIRHIFSIETVSVTGRVLIKLVPVLSDLAAGFLLYIIAKRKFSESSSLFLAAAYVCNPVVVLDSSVWGQTDGTFTFLVLLTCYFCMEEKRIPAYFSFVIGILLKPQTLIFAPVILWTIIEQVFLHDFNKEKLIKDLIGGVASIVAMILLVLPFGFGKVLHQYVDTLGSYQYCTINAYNIWALAGKNWADQSGEFLSIEYRHWGMAAIVAAVVLSAVVFFKLKEDKSRYFISMSIVVSTMFLFSVRMHERYLFPVLVLTLAAFLLRPTRELFFTYVGFSVVQFLNVYHVLYFFVELDSTGPNGGILGITALLTLAMYGYLLFACFSKSNMQEMRPMPAQTKKGNFKPYTEIKENKKEQKTEDKETKRGIIRASIRMPSMTKKDWAVLFGSMLFYSLFALHDLGYSTAPQTGWNYYNYEEKTANTDDPVIILDMGEPVKVDMLHTFLGNYENRDFQLDLSEDGTSYESVGVISAGSVFCWNEMQVKDSGRDSYNLVKKYRYVRLTAQNNESVLKELIIADDQGNVCEPVNIEEYSALFDEQDCYKNISTFRDGTYFDEIYHARTAYEMIQKLYCYENTHPPLGKYFISMGIRLFGMTPFGWRIVGTIFGIMMLPFMFFFGRRLFGGRTWAAGAVTFLFSFDFMHFTQTRIATIDVYGTFFIIAMFFFMYWYSQTSFYDTDLKKTWIPLGLSAIMMGLGCASKWTAVYAAAGLAIFFAVIMIRRYLEYREACKTPEEVTEGISHEHIIAVYKKNTIFTLLFCVVFFIVLAGGIYLASYIPFSDGAKDNAARFRYVTDSEYNPKNTTEFTERYRNLAGKFEKHNGAFSNLVGKMVKNQRDMYVYHSTLDATHSYASEWYKWPTMIRPVFYYCKTLEDGSKEGISAFGNPLVWWAGIPAFFILLFLSFYSGKKRADWTALFLVFGYLVQYVPWMSVSRCTFAYHYFPSVPFLAMMIVYIMYRLVERDKRWMKWCMSYLAAAFVLFLLFYPVLSGEPVSETYVRDGLRWLSGWVLVL